MWTVHSPEPPAPCSQRPLILAPSAAASSSLPVPAQNCQHALWLRFLRPFPRSREHLLSCTWHWRGLVLTWICTDCLQPEAPHPSPEWWGQSSSVQCNRSVLSDAMRPQHSRPPCPSPTSEVYSNSCPLSQWCHPTKLSSVVPFSSCPQSFPASGSLQVS